MAYLGESIPKLGFGLMRLPMAGGQVELDQVNKMVDLFLDSGFTYFDTAFGYLEGKSEVAAREALVRRYPRERFQLATKMPAWDAPNAEAARAMLATSLERTGAGYFDYYLLHNLDRSRVLPFDQFGLWDYLAEQKRRGVIRHLGFSFHDKADFLHELLTQHPEMEFVQLQINYADWESPDIEARACYEVARKHNKPIIVMEPVKGGSLASLPEKAAAALKEGDPDASLSSWALRYAASLDGLITVLSGMSTIGQMEDNVKTMRDFRPLDERERAFIGRAQAALNQAGGIPCTACEYCVKNCPAGVAIPGIFRAMNNLLVFENVSGAKGNYRWETRDGGTADKCVACGRCEGVCPQHIGIIEQLARAHQALG